jgi:hypothetical protein
MPGKAFRIKRQNEAGETLHIPKTNACRCCYRPIPATSDAYCSREHEAKHQRLLHGRHSFACTIDETAA